MKSSSRHRPVVLPPFFFSNPMTSGCRNTRLASEAGPDFGLLPNLPRTEIETSGNCRTPHRSGVLSILNASTSPILNPVYPQPSRSTAAPELPCIRQIIVQLPLGGGPNERIAS